MKSQRTNLTTFNCGANGKKQGTDDYEVREAPHRNGKRLIENQSQLHGRLPNCINLACNGITRRIGKSNVKRGDQAGVHRNGHHMMDIYQVPQPIPMSPKARFSLKD